MAPFFMLCLPALFLAMAIPAQAEEKVLNLYSWADYVAPDTLQRFEKETGIHVRPESVAALTNTLFFATANRAATPLVDEAVRNDPDIYPQSEVRGRLYADHSMSLKDMRQRTRLWTTFRSRQ
ncbi:hypothetical protein [Pseudomonas sp. Irchel s3b2]|uniref:hypothetical protein n=1 Tax=Pseudomonas sp. Irchel s3b2 TaxID=2009073 RepID=UPI000BA41355|nr:hypothetical protein [Pseudomonas sp. Irchel s3b2]